MPQALAQVKRHLGPDAVIVQTRSYKRGGLLGFGARSVVEITARSADSAAPPPRPRSAAHRLQRLYNGGSGSTSLSARTADSALPPRTVGSSQTAVLERRSRAALATETDRIASVSNGLDLHTNLESDSAQPVRSALSKRTVPPVCPVGNLRNDRMSLLAADTRSASTDAQIGSEIGEIRQLVESLVKEQRQLHEPQMPEQLFDLYLSLIQREVADEIARDMIERIQRDMTGNQLSSADVARQKLVQVMDGMINTTGPICPNLDGAARVVALIGPTGVGKTTTIAKIAANLKLRQNKKVGLITIDTYRIGAVDQLRMYARIIDVPIKVVLTPVELKETVESMRDLDVVLIDTAGRCQNDQLKLTELKTFMDAASPDETHLVLSSTTHHAHMLSAAEKFGALGVDRIILTKLDEAISFGVVLSVLRKVDASISYVTTGQDVPDDIEIGNGRRIAQMLLGIEKINKHQPIMLDNAV